jgi:hypothetical protein
MKVLITKNYIYTHLSCGTLQQHKEHKIFKNWIQNNKGKWIDIDTNYTFYNQYNTKDGYRIYDTWIDEVKDDVRNDKNIFFVKYPKGKDKISSTHDIDFKDHRKNERFLSCYSCNGNYYRISRRSNIEFILVGSEIFIANDIGYTPLKKSRLSSNEIDILKYCANRILTNKF